MDRVVTISANESRARVSDQAAAPGRVTGQPDGRAPQFYSVLFTSPQERRESRQPPEFFHDLNLDQVVAAITTGWSEYDLMPFLQAPLRNLEQISYRQAIMQDVQRPAVMKAVNAFSQAMHSVRENLLRAKKGEYPRESQRWFLDAVKTYCESVHQFHAELANAPLESRGLITCLDFLTSYLDTEAFKNLAAEAKKLSDSMAGVRYTLLLDEDRITVGRYEGEIDYTAAVEQTFEKFSQGSVKSYLAELSPPSGMNHIQSQILEGIAQLYPDTFEWLAAFCSQNRDFQDAIILQLDREIQFYTAYLNFIQKFEAAGLRFSYPSLSSSSKVVSVRQTFDLALGTKLLTQNQPLVTNDFHLNGSERIFIVSGPNQGGKTTFARTFGQLHYLASLGFPVPGVDARLFLFDQIFTHFEREEDINNLRGKLHDDLVRIRTILDHATPSSIVIMNELFSSTTLRDAVFLGRKIMDRISRLDLLAVFVTFLNELASFNEKTVSVVSTVDARDPAIRTFHLERRQAEGVAYALAVAEKYRVTYDRLKERIEP